MAGGGAGDGEEMLNCMGMFLGSVGAEELMCLGDVFFSDVTCLTDRCLTLSRAKPSCRTNTQLPNRTSNL